MLTITRRIVAVIAGLWIAGLLAVGAPAAQGTEIAGSLAVGVSKLPCGYDGRVNGIPTYNHCGRGSVVIEVDHLFWQHTYACMPRGAHAIPQGNVSWAIIGAEFDGHTCGFRVPVVVGP